MLVTRLDPSSVALPMSTYAHSVRVETEECVWIYVSGQIAQGASGNLVGAGDMRAQTEQVFTNLSRILESNGATFEHVVKIQTFLTSMDDLAGSREVRARFIPAEPPASTAVQVVALVVPEALIEVDLVAVVPL